MLHLESAKLTVMLWWGRSPILRTFSLAISRAGRTRSMENNRLLSLGMMVAIFITWGFSAMSPRTDASIQITERSLNSTYIIWFKFQNQTLYYRFHTHEEGRIGGQFCTEEKIISMTLSKKKSHREKMTQGRNNRLISNLLTVYPFNLVL